MHTVHTERYHHALLPCPRMPSLTAFSNHTGVKPETQGSLGLGQHRISCPAISILVLSMHKGGIRCIVVLLPSFNVCILTLFPTLVLLECWGVLHRPATYNACKCGTPLATDTACSQPAATAIHAQFLMTWCRSGTGRAGCLSCHWLQHAPSCWSYLCNSCCCSSREESLPLN